MLEGSKTHYPCGIRSKAVLANYVLVTAVVAVELISFLAPLNSSAPSYAAGVVAPVLGDRGIASLELAAAASSLRAGDGPAGGSPGTCSPPAGSGAGASCGPGGTHSPVKVILHTLPSWSLPVQPAPRQLASLTYDARDKYVLLFGGANGTAVLGDSWTFVAGSWTHLHPATSPPARSAAAMTFDGADNYVLLFGGFTRTTGLTDTWKFAGGVWTKLTPTSNPGALAYASMTYDAKDGYVVFFGGITIGLVVKSATWEFKAGQWTLLTPSPAPAGRLEAAFAYDAKDGYAVLFGGSDATFKALGDTWNYSGGHWTKLTPSPAPDARSGAALAYSAKDHELLLFGGLNGTTYFSASWVFAAGAWSKISTAAHPSNRGGLAMADGSAASNIVLFGGQTHTGGYLNDTWVFSAGAWAHALPHLPPIRSSPAMTYDEGDHYVLLFGGVGAGLYGDTWKFAHGIWTQLHPSIAPSPRYGPTMAYDPADGYVVLFGGAVPSGSFGIPLNDTWTFAAGSWTHLVTPTQPTGRGWAGLAFDYADGYLLLFGGFNASSLTAYSDTWTFSGGSWTQTAASGPSARSSAGQMVYDSADGYVVLFSGNLNGGAGTSQYPDTWTYLAGTWTNLTGSLSTSPPGRAYGGLVDDTYDGYLVLFGGINQNTVIPPDTWSFTNGVWTLLSPAVHPPIQAQFGMVFDAADNAVVLLSTTYPYTTWTY
ncbi:MAG: kelch repeat-containing protein [Thermoplasmata archaeon]|nr:kelch repeat-containing protein [Thermoplasmata archaeon]